MVSSLMTIAMAAQQRGFRLTGEQVVFGLAFLMITALLFITTHSWIMRLFLTNSGRKDTMTYFATWTIIIVFFAVSLFIANWWWFNYNANGLRPVVQQWLIRMEWNIR